MLAFCWAHWRRQFFDLAKSPPAPIATEALKRIAGLYEIEAEIRGKSAEERGAQEKTKPLVSALKTWLESSPAAQRSLKPSAMVSTTRTGWSASLMTTALRSIPTPSSGVCARSF